MINSSDHSLPLGRTTHVTGADHNSSRAMSAKDSAPAPAADRITLDRAAQVREQLESLPIVRSERVAAAKALVVSPNYPPLEIIRRIAETLLASSDLTESSEIS